MNKSQIRKAVSAVAVTGTIAFASNVTLPHSFQPNTPARAAEVNANFSAVKAAIDDNNAQITALKARFGGGDCGSGAVKFAGICIEVALRPGLATWPQAARVCDSAGGFLCPTAVLTTACFADKVRLVGVTGDAEWTGDVALWELASGKSAYWGVLAASPSAVSQCSVMPLVTTSLPDAETARSQNHQYRCCFRP